MLGGGGHQRPKGLADSLHHNCKCTALTASGIDGAYGEVLEWVLEHSPF